MGWHGAVFIVAAVMTWNDVALACAMSGASILTEMISVILLAILLQRGIGAMSKVSGN